MTGSKPLAGRTVMVTRPAEEAEGLVALLEARGARALAVPTIRIEPGGSGLDGALRGLAAGRFDWMTLTSRATVRVLRAAIDATDMRAKVAVVGEGTAQAYTEWTGRSPDLMPRTYETVTLGAAFPPGNGRVLCLRADIAPAGLEDAIRSKGWRAVRADAYRTVLSRRFEPDISAALHDGLVDAVTFTSASTVRGFVRALTGPPVTAPAKGIRVACIGPVTAAEARSCGFRVHAVARPHTTQALAEAVERALRRAPTR
jgi:uroporphyrinogen-III synthase